MLLKRPEFLIEVNSNDGRLASLPVLNSREGLVENRATAATESTALLVMNSGCGLLLCPFFHKCDGVLLRKVDGSQQFYSRDPSSGQSICDLLLALNPARVICGFIDVPGMQRLRAIGMDVRLGSCSCPIDELVDSFANLPSA